jgi:hypothetical protein
MHPDKKKRPLLKQKSLFEIWLVNMEDLLKNVTPPSTSLLSA